MSEIEKLIKGNAPFAIIRPGLGGDFMVPFFMEKKVEIPYYYLNLLTNNAGIYFRTDDIINNENDKKDLIEYAILCNKAYKCADLIAVLNSKHVINISDYFIKKYNIKKIPGRYIEPYYNSPPWTRLLKGKRVLIIHPFEKTIKKQYLKRELLFKNKETLPDCTLLTYKTFMTLGNNKIHESWKQTYEIMCNDIKKINFDIALLGCGGYGHPLVHFIRNNMKKSAIYMGGALQILFGIKGKRWDNHQIISTLYNEHWCYPEEIPKNYEKIENGCYWK